MNSSGLLRYAPPLQRPVLGIIILFSMPCLFSFTPLTPVFFALLLLITPLQAIRREGGVNFSNPMVFLSIAYFFGFITDYYLYEEDEGTLSVLLSDFNLIRQALLWAYRGFAAMLCAYNLSWFFMAKRSKLESPLVMPISVSINRLVAFLGLAYITGFVIETLLKGGISTVFLSMGSSVDVPSSFSQLIVYLKYCSYFYVYFASHMQASKIPLTGFNKQLRWLVVVCIFLTIAGAGSKAVVFEHVIAFITPFLLNSRKISLKLIFISGSCLLILLLTFRTVTIYREYIRQDSMSEKNGSVAIITYQLGVFRKSVSESFEELFLGEQKSLARTQTVEAVYGRLGFLRSIALLNVFSDGIPPYENALKTFLIPVYAFLPRSLIPGKAIFFGSGNLAKRVGWESGGFSISLIGSLYWTWGYIGITAGMIFLGFFLSRLTFSCHYNSSYRSWVVSGGLMIYTVLTMLDVGKSFHDIAIDFIRFYVMLNIVSAITAASVRKVAGKLQVQA